MRIRSLSFRGVGPYLGPQRIDFDGLGESGLYLINGPTGAGKSTIIDCICFALYGKPASDEADSSRMRSDFATAKDPTEVDLVFETAAGVFRVIRTPGYLRAKERGTGVTEAKASCRLFRVRPDGHEETIATTISSADSELARAVGLTREQFVQTVVLPQGQFAKFLYSDTKDRAEILKRIFDTRLYERVAEILKEEAAEAGEARRSATEAIQAAVRHVCTLLSLDEEVRDRLLRFAADGLDPDLTAALQSVRPGLAQACEEATVAARRAQDRAEKADQARARARTEADAQGAVAGAAEAMARCVTAAEQAHALVSPFTGLAQSMTIAVDDDLEPETWRRRASAAAGSAGHLRGLIPAEEEVLSWPDHEREAKASIDELRARQHKDAARLEELPRFISAAQALIDDRPLLDDVSALQARQQELAVLVERYAQIDLLDARLPDLEAAVKEALEAERVIAAELELATRSYRDGIAADLALQLQDGSPCPVCGATEHPEPASHGPEPVPYDAVEALGSRLTAALVTLEGARATLTQARQARDDLAALTGMSRDSVAEAVRSLQAEEQALNSRSDAADTADRQVRALREELDAVSARSRTAEADITRAQAGIEARAKAVEALVKQVSEARAGSPSLSERLERVRELESALTALADRLVDLQAARAVHEKATADLGSLPDREGFGDVDAAQQAWQEADRQRIVAEGERAEAAGLLDHLDAGIREIDRLCTTRQEQIQQSADLIELAELFNAGRGSDVGLHIYVLKSLFANVMEAANRRFENLLNGRYRLVRAPDTEGDRRSLQGLGVSVEDRLTGTVRSARSLSGGETFCASLALALGLSDVVRMSAGGIEIESLFIDEGFGSLDSDQLEEVMLMLGHLSRGGRRVGVISHVDTMKSAIAERIDIAKATEDRPTSLSVTWMT